MNRPRPILLAATLFGITAGILLGLRPWRAYIEERADVRARDTELKGARKDRIELEHEAAKTRSEIGREENARANGYQRKNEVPLAPK